MLHFLIKKFKKKLDNKNFYLIFRIDISYIDVLLNYARWWAWRRMRLGRGPRTAASYGACLWRARAGMRRRARSASRRTRSCSRRCPWSGCGRWWTRCRRRRAFMCVRCTRRSRERVSVRAECVDSGFENGGNVIDY